MSNLATPVSAFNTSIEYCADKRHSPHSVVSHGSNLASESVRRRDYLRRVRNEHSAGWACVSLRISAIPFAHTEWFSERDMKLITK